MTPIGTINLRTGCKIAINTLTLPYGTSPELWKKWGRQQPPCIIASHFTMCVLVWVFERGSLATPFLPSKMKCLFHTAGEILGAPYESVNATWPSAATEHFFQIAGFFRRPQTPDGPTTTTSVTTSGSTTSGSAASAVRPLQYFQKVQTCILNDFALMEVEFQSGAKTGHPRELSDSIWAPQIESLSSPGSSGRPW